MQLLISCLLIAVSLIHIAPGVGMLGANWLTTLYGLEFADANLQILMRHRAILFGLIGTFMLYAAFARHYQLAAILIAIVSTGSFLLLAWLVGDYNAQLAKVARLDMVALIASVIALFLTVSRS